MEFVYIVSPLRGKVKENIRRANDYCRFAAQQGVVPLAPHVMFTGFLDDTIPEERQMGMTLGIEIIKTCSAVWVFGSTISEGMRAEIMLAQELNIPIIYYNEKFEGRNSND